MNEISFTTNTLNLASYVTRLCLCALLMFSCVATSTASSFKISIDPAVQPLIDQYNFDFDSVQSRLKKFIESNLEIDQELVIKIYGGQESYIDTQLNVAYVPVSAIANLHESVQRRYPTQPSVREELLSSAIEQVYWQQVVRLLVSALELQIEGEETFVLDGFVTLMQLNLYDTPYILDAAEELLKVDKYFPVFSASAYKTESEFDKARYHHIACLVLGRDIDAFEGVLSSLAWGESRLKACQKQYVTELERWRLSLKPYLTKNSPLNG